MFRLQLHYLPTNFYCASHQHQMGSMATGGCCNSLLWIFPSVELQGSNLPCCSNKVLCYSRLFQSFKYIRCVDGSVGLINAFSDRAVLALILMGVLHLVFGIILAVIYAT